MNTPFESVPFVYDGRDRIVLPIQFSPGDDVVIIGRGKKVQQHPANRRFRALIQAQLEAYSNAATKGLKSNILWRVLHEVRSYSQSRLGFVKRDSDTGRWYAIDDASAKINISQAFRDGLHSDYKSSKKRKQIKRKVDMGEPVEEEGKLERNIFEALTRFDTIERSSPPTKRVCVATNERVMPPLAASDHTLDRIGSTMDRLRNFLVNPSSNVSEGNQLSMNLKPKRNDSWDTFAGLYKKFGSQSSEDPFEPKPILAQSSSTNLTFGEELENAFPTFPISAMVEATNPPPPAAVLAARPDNNQSQEFDPVSCLQEALLPSILSLTSLELSDAGTLNGMGSLSSISTIDDCQELQAWDSDRGGNSRNAILQLS